MTDRFESKTVTVTAPHHGDVELSVDSVSVTEQQIDAQRTLLRQELHSCYQTLATGMQPWMEQWNKNPVLACKNALDQGKMTGANKWLEDQADLLDKDLWSNLWTSTKEQAIKSWDMAAYYSPKVYDAAKNAINEKAEQAEELWEAREDTILNPSWLEQRYIEVEEDTIEQISELKSDVKEFVDDVKDQANEVTDDVRQVIKHHRTILELPEHIMRGDSDEVEHFVDTVLYDIDPSFADSIKDNPNYYAFLEAIADHDTAMIIGLYMNLMLQATPLNFYFYVAGSAGAYAAIEAVLLIVGSMLTAGGALAVRMTQLTARFALVAAKSQKVASATNFALDSIDTFIATLKRVTRIMEDHVLKIGKMLNIARAKSLLARGATGGKSTLKDKKKFRDDGPCRLCKSTDHQSRGVRYKSLVDREGNYRGALEKAAKKVPGHPLIYEHQHGRASRYVDRRRKRI